jgi:hypothetical protein
LNTLNTVLLYCTTPTTRLQYVCEVVFQQHAGLQVAITSNATEFELAQTVLRINYSSEKLHADVHWVPSGLLFETGIRSIEPQTISVNNKPCLFPVSGGDSAFDILSAVFYCISRYEEYTCTTRDAFQRFPHTESWAFQQQVLNRPIVDEWIWDLLNAWKNQFPSLAIKANQFEFIPTYDIDIAYSYYGKPWYKQVASWMRGEFGSWLRWKRGLAKDPYDAFDQLDAWHTKYGLSPIYFMLLSEGGAYNKNLPVRSLAMQALLVRLKKQYTVGLHPSYCDAHADTVWQHEKSVLGETKHTRQHYIRFTLPNTYRVLESLGFEHEYSMGYGSINGFRASTSRMFYWYDIEQERISTLQVHPFCFMECNSRFEQGLSPSAAAAELASYEQAVRTVSGTLITIWHNFSLGTAADWKGWDAVYADWVATQRNGRNTD